MNFHPGERLHGAGPPSQPGGYVVSAVVRETPWYNLYAGKKVLYNFDFTSKRVRETDDKEWLDVFLRTLRYPRLDDAQDVARRRAVARAEVRILGNRGSNLWPEPIDLLEIDNTRDTFTFPPDQHDREPIVVFARPHGQPLGDWQQGVVTVASLLSILAELLEFIRQTHAEGLLLQGLGPAAILIDRADRVHYIGSEMVVEQQTGAGWGQPLTPDPSPQGGEGRFVRGQLFPAERYPRGFAPPELFDPRRAPSPRSDLYAWGTLTYFLLTGHNPWQIALEQGRPWAQFQEPHFVKLEQALRSIPPAHVAVWAEEMGLSGPALLQNWPHNVVAMFRWLLHAEAARRPRSADELRTWMVALPPAQVRGALALDAGGGQARVYLDAAAFETGAEIEVRRAVGQPPGQPGLGECVYEGPLRPVVVDEHAPLTEEPFFYTVFTRRRYAGGAVYSGGVETQAVEPTARALLPIIEAEAASADGDELPPRIALAFSAMDAVGLAEILLEARAARARGWGLRRLGEMRGHGPEALRPEALRLVERSLTDPAPELRLEAARILWQTGAGSDAALLRIAHALGAGQLDDAIQAADSFRAIGVPADQRQRVIDKLEGERPTTCPLCEVQLARRERAVHLRTIHGYVDVGGAVLPRKQAVARLWDRVFHEGDRQAHAQLLDIYSDDATRNGAGYAEALAAEIVRRPELDERGGQGLTAWKRWEPWLACVRQVQPREPVLRHLVLAEAERVREVGRALVLPQLGERLRGDAFDITKLRRLIEEVFPGPELVTERIRLCGQLPQVGVDQTKAIACQALFEEELPLRCPECPAQVRAKDLEVHLRRAHGIFQFRGVRRGYNETRDYLLEAVCAPRPDIAAWQALEGLAEDRHGEAPAARLVVWVCHTLKRLDKEPRRAAVPAVGETIAGAGSGLSVLPHLLADDADPAWKNIARHLALAVTAHLQDLPPPGLLQQIRPYLAAKVLPAEARQNAVAGLLKVMGGAGAVADEVLEAYVSATSKVRAAEKLQALEAIVGQAPAIERLAAEVEDRIRMTCPRCTTQLERRDMVKHLWDRHRLLLEGRRVREPWRVLADWVVDYRLEKDPRLLERCRALAEQVDPEEGTLRLQRLMLRQGLEDRDAWEALVGRARQKKASLCPYCFAQVPVPAAATPEPLLIDDHRLEGHGYALELSEAGVTPRLILEAFGGVLAEGRAPDAWLTTVGAVALFGVPAAGLLAAVLWSLALPWPLIAGLAVGCALLLGGLTFLLWPARQVQARLIDLAWMSLVPELLEQPLSEDGCRFLGALAESSRGQGSPSARRQALEQVEEAVSEQRGPLFWPGLAAVWRLHLAELHEAGADPVPALVALVEHVFSGQAPARALAGVLGDIRDVWPRGRLVRAQALLTARGVELGLETADLADLARAQPVLAPLLGTQDLDRVAQLRIFWRMRSSWPRWLERADNVFDLARHAAGEKDLAEHPDLLLLVRNAPIRVGTRGVWLKDACVNAMPPQVDVVARRHADGEGFEIIAGPQRVWFTANPNEIADDLEGWLRYYFRDLLPQVAAEHARSSSAAGLKLRRANAVACPECRQLVLPIAGEVGLRAEGASVLT